MQVIGLLGVKGSGKDTFAAELVAEFGFQRIGFADKLYQEVSEAYQTPISFLNKRETKESPLAELALHRCSNPEFVETALRVLKVSGRVREQCLKAVSGQRAYSSQVRKILQRPRSPRWTMQLWGTEYRRTGNFGVDNYWLQVVSQKIMKNPEDSFVITDVRFLNEASFVREIGGKLVRVRRPVLEAREAVERQARGTAAHPSEVELLDFKTDFEIINEESKPESLRKGFSMLGLIETEIA